jgi:ATP-dependent Lon protease
MESGKNILLVAQKSAAKDEPVPEDMYEIGCLANILQMLKLPDGTVKVLVEGVQRARVLRIEDQKALFVADVSLIPVEERPDNEVEAMRRTVSGPVRPVRQTEQEDSARGFDVAGGH